MHKQVLWNFLFSTCVQYELIISFSFTYHRNSSLQTYANCEAPIYEIFLFFSCSLLGPDILLSILFSSTPNHILPLWQETKFFAHAKQQVKYF
jgi:hypothetical protein